MRKLTPMMQQYMEIKNQYKDALMFFRLGDFYELFFDDAETASRELEITLTARDCGLESKAPMCGVPYHAANGYIDKLVSKGYKVAICEQVEDPSVAKGIVKRDVVRVITPGTLIDTNLLEDKKNNYLVSLYMSSLGCGFSYVDISTGELLSTEIVGTSIEQNLIDEISKIEPNELIYFVEEEDKIGTNFIEGIRKKLNIHISKYDPWTFEESYAMNQIKNQFNILTVESLGFSLNHLGINATGALIHYLKSTQKRTLSHINKINIYTFTEKMVLDISTRRNLELTETIRGKNKKGSLLWILDKTQTAMGGRMIRKWIEEPLLNIQNINRRLEAVATLKNDILLRCELKESLKQIYDLERLSGKIAFGSATPRDLVALKKSVAFLPDIKKLFENENSGLLKELLNNIDTLEDIQALIESSILDEPSISLKDGGIIKEGYNDELDELYVAAREGKHWIAKLEQAEKDRTGIKSLKVGYNKIFGYYIEITKSNLHLAPENYIRKQTLANCERYITPELKELEDKILGAEEKSIAIEYEQFIEIRNMLLHEIERIQRTARAVAELDVLYSFAEAASENNYVKPTVNSSETIDIKEGRHPVVEKVLENNMFISNDTYINTEDEQLLMITGPNMAGKSTYMRQVALIILMAQIGSFVPATSATIGITDRIFTRVGANDDLSQGQSTFMVEMSEMATIVNLATKKSLLIVDEIGRGTSTFDGLSIAWSTAEYICQSLGSRTLFSTHYHELTKLSETYRGIKNYKVLVKEDKEDVIFLHKVVKGNADRSYGIQVAKLAGLPAAIITRASHILSDLERESIQKEQYIIESTAENTLTASTDVANEKQLKLDDFIESEIVKDLKKINLLETTPMDALNILYQLQKKVAEI
uniref:DNA mismatch repair protein MutS n=2 Tax=Alkaliphilus oremlandii TaxID=461876 RepID=MUTS_ALKOO|nr:DNA mismatch repair protein MutS [Alkaliphilus oremlandii]A8MFD4.2 RecName: Full=DNA mismatch repair protein MutS [Alkaliphilus oremlandii OhILAs]